MTDDWQAEARRVRRSRLNSWAVSIGCAVLGTPLLLFGSEHAGPLAAAAIVAGVTLLVVAMLYGTWVYMRRIDEQERMANLWSTYVGVNVYAVLFLVDMFLRHRGVVTPQAPEMIFGATGASILVVFAWLRFR